jgi:hypothetical protein
MKMAVRRGQNGGATTANGVDDNDRRDQTMIPSAVASSSLCRSNLHDAVQRKEEGKPHKRKYPPGTVEEARALFGGIRPAIENLEMNWQRLMLHVNSKT